MNKNIRTLTYAAVIAAAYVVLTAVFAPICFGAVQFRISEALTVLPFVSPSAVPGLFVGCLIANLLFSVPLDAVVGSLTTLAAAFWVSRMKHRWLAPLPAALLNGLLVGAVITYTTTGLTAAFWPTFAWVAFTVALGELVVGYLLGMPLLLYCEKWFGRYQRKGESHGRNARHK